MTSYAVEIRPMVWRIDGRGAYALVLAKSAGAAARKARSLHRRGLLGNQFDEIERVSGPWERNPRHVLASE